MGTGDRAWDVVVVGAGLAGLAAGTSAAGDGLRTLIVDARPTGGRARTDRHGRFRFNRGPHAFYRGGPGEAVLARIGVAVSGAPAVIRGAQGRIGDRVELLPTDRDSVAGTRLLQSGSKPALARMLAGASRWRPEEVTGVSIAEWLDGFELPDDARAVAAMFVRLSSYLADESASADVPATRSPSPPGRESSTCTAAGRLSSMPWSRPPAPAGQWSERRPRCGRSRPTAAGGSSTARCWRSGPAPWWSPPALPRPAPR